MIDLRDWLVRNLGKCRYKMITYQRSDNLVPRVLWLFGQRMGASRDSGEFENISIFCFAALQRLPLFYHRNLAVTEFQYPRVSTGAHPLTKKPEDSGYEIGGVKEVIDQKLVLRFSSGVPGSSREYCLELFSTDFKTILRGSSFCTFGVRVLYKTKTLVKFVDNRKSCCSLLLLRSIIMFEPFQGVFVFGSLGFRFVPTLDSRGSTGFDQFCQAIGERCTGQQFILDKILIQFEKRKQERSTCKD